MLHEMFALRQSDSLDCFDQVGDQKTIIVNSVIKKLKSEHTTLENIQNEQN